MGNTWSGGSPPFRSKKVSISIGSPQGSPPFRSKEVSISIGSPQGSPSFRSKRSVCQYPPIPSFKSELEKGQYQYCQYLGQYQCQYQYCQYLDQYQYQDFHDFFSIVTSYFSKFSIGGSGGGDKINDAKSL